MVDMAHIAGLVATGLHPNPVPYADIVTGSTTKTMCGPHSGFIMCKAHLADAVDKSVYPGNVASLHLQTIAAMTYAIGASQTDEFRALARYFVARYWLQAVSDYDLVCRVKLAVVSCLVVKALGGNVIDTAQLYSKEIENDADNVDAILDAAYTHPAFTDDKLLGLLMNP